MLSSWVTVIPNKPKLVSIIFFGVFVENKLPIDVKEWEETEIIVTSHVSKRMQLKLIQNDYIWFFNVHFLELAL